MKNIAIYVESIGILIQLFCLWHINKRVKFWKELREEAKKLYEEAYRDRADLLDKMLEEKLDKTRKNSNDRGGKICLMLLSKGF